MSTAVEKIVELQADEVITPKMLSAQHACAEGLRWVIERFPDGTAYKNLLEALESDGKDEWALWLVEHCGVVILASKWRIEQIQKETKKNKDDSNYAKIGSSGYSAKIGSSGYSAKIGSSGDYAKIGSSGYYAQIGSSGYSAQIGSSGDYAKIGSSGYSAQIGSSGDYAKIGSSGYYAQIEASGKKSIVAAVGPGSIVSAGEDGCIAASWWDEKKERFRMLVGYVGEDGILPNTFYKIENGSWVKV